MPQTGTHEANPGQSALRRKELITFLMLAFAIWPITAVALVGGYGFLVWIWQMIFGPPGPTGG
jgi:periplasmic nitrate reductase NapE